MKIFSRVRKEIRAWFCCSLIKKFSLHCRDSTKTQMTWSHMLILDSRAASMVNLDPRVASMLRLDPRAASMLMLDHRAASILMLDPRTTPMPRIDLRPTRTLRTKARPTLTTCTTMEDGSINEEPGLSYSDIYPDQNIFRIFSPK